MSEREAILGRVREALSVKSPRGAAHPLAPLRPLASQTHPARQWLPAIGDAFEANLAVFQRHAVDLKADVQLVSSLDELRGAMLALRDREGWKKVGSHRGELIDPVTSALSLPVCHTDQPYDVRELEACDAGITECDALVAQTGSVLVTTRSAGGRALSVLPPHHVVLARRPQLLPDLPAAFALLQERYSANYPSFISFITGPSRTGDIERILVLGAHGPKKLTIFIW